MWLDDEPIVDAWGGPAPVDVQAARQVGEGVHHVVVEYANDGGDGMVQLRWELSPPPSG